MVPKWLFQGKGCLALRVTKECLEWPVLRVECLETRCPEWLVLRVECLETRCQEWLVLRVECLER